MSDRSVMSARQAGFLDRAFERNKFRGADVHALADGDLLTKIRMLIHGHADLTVHEGNFIDCDQDPELPKGCRIHTHRRHRIINWDPAMARLLLHPGQKGGSVSGHQVHRFIKEAKVKPCNGIIPPYLDRNTRLIPREWWGKSPEDRGKPPLRICFWGTIIRAENGELMVRTFHYNDANGEWWGDYIPLSEQFTDRFPAAVFVE